MGSRRVVEDDDAENSAAEENGRSESEDTEMKEKKTTKKNPSTKRKKSAIIDDESEEETKKETKKSNGKKEDKKKKVKKEEEDENVYKWWKESDEKIEEMITSDQKWTTLKHNGMLFAPEYEPHGIPLYYDGKPVKLTVEQEEVATMYAACTTSEVFEKKTFKDNFWKQFKEVLGKGHLIKDFSKCDFSKIWEHILTQREINNNRPSEEKKLDRELRAKKEHPFQYAYVDGRKEKVVAFKAEPPGLFRGRGNHPKMGLIKGRVKPEDVTINIGRLEDCPPPPPGHKWKEVITNNKVLWLAAYKDSLSGRLKYVQFSATSSLKSVKDYMKYQTARKLKDIIEKIRKNYKKLWDSELTADKQLGVCIYFIDKLALRVGNEKDDDEADTVGCCTLRKEHIELVEPSTLKFDFLGKDSIRYINTVEVEKKVFSVVKELLKGKKKDSMLFDEINATKVNSHLKSYYEKLSAKVFRTFNASTTLDRELKRLEKDITDDMSVDEKIAVYNNANREVAILCNHQRAVPKTFEQSVGTMDKNIEDLENFIKRLQKAAKDMNKLGQEEVERKWQAENEKIEKKYEQDLEEYEKKVKEIEQKAKEAGKSVAAYLGTTKKEKPPKKPSIKKIPKNIEKEIEKSKERLKKLTNQKQMKCENKAVSLHTSKMNYMDPRISISWCKRNSVPVEKIFSKTIREKFPWAMDAEEDYTF
ncbi:hypothetical protein ABK040_000142 [Willaertia magna]